MFDATIGLCPVDVCSRVTKDEHLSRTNGFRVRSDWAEAEPFDVSVDPVICLVQSSLQRFGRVMLNCSFVHRGGDKTYIDVVLSLKLVQLVDESGIGPVHHFGMIFHDTRVIKKSEVGVVFT